MTHRLFLDTPKREKMLETARDTSPASDDTDNHAASLTASVFDWMREDLLSGRLAPGEKLRIESLRQRYKVGATPLREALTRLAGIGLITHIDQKGFRVAPVSRAEALELTRTRCWLEEVAVRESIANGDDAWEEGLLLAHHRLAKSTRSRNRNEFAPNPEWERRHRAFHLALIAACGSRWLLEYSSQLHDQADRYRRIAVVASYPRRNELKEHTAIKDAALARDSTTAAALLRDHYERTSTIIVDALPDPAEPLDSQRS